MSNAVTINVYEIVGSELCVAASDGQKVYDQIQTALQMKKMVLLTFRNVTGLTSAFLNAAIGQLYSTFDEVTIRAGLRVRDMNPEDRALLKRVVDTAKEYFKDPDRFKKANREILGDEHGKKGSSD